MTGEAKVPKASKIPDFIRFPLVLGLVCLASGLSLSWLYGKTSDRIKASEKRKLLAAFEELAPGYDEYEEVRIGAEKTEDGRAFTYYRLLDPGGRTVGFACETLGPGSYNSIRPIRAVTVVGPDLKRARVLGMRITFSEETPGLGEKIKEMPAANSLVGLLTGRPSVRRVQSEAVSADTVRVLEESDREVTIEYEGDGGALERKTLPRGQVRFMEFVPWFQDQFSGLGGEELGLKGEGGGVDAITGATVSSRASVDAVREAVRLIKRYAM